MCSNLSSISSLNYDVYWVRVLPVDGLLEGGKKDKGVSRISLLVAGKRQPCRAELSLIFNASPPEMVD
jgi:hypothetical protein